MQVKNWKMNTKDNLVEKILVLKKSLIKHYVYGTVATLFFFFLYDFFIVNERILSYYLLGGIFFLIYTWVLIKKSFDIDKIVHRYFIISPWYTMFIIVKKWEVSVVDLSFFIILPLGAYIFFSKKEIVWYSLYSVFLIFFAFLLSNYIDLPFKKYNINMFNPISDIMIFLFVLGVIVLALYYNDRIRHIKHNSPELIIKEEEKPKNNFLNNDERKNELFFEIENYIEDHLLFKNPDFNLSSLSVKLGINSKYISNAIKSKGFANFNHYLNICRINHVKNLFEENDMKKITLMYIYTEAGFTNQTTFNRVFKQVEGITPTEYLKQIQ